MVAVLLLIESVLITTFAMLLLLLLLKLSLIPILIKIKSRIKHQIPSKNKNNEAVLANISNLVPLLSKIFQIKYLLFHI